MGARMPTLLLQWRVCGLQSAVFEIHAGVFPLPSPVIQELKRRYDALDTKMDVLKAETRNGG